MNPDVMARGLGWFSIGLGVAELVAARALARSLGMQGHENLIRAFGAREIVQGISCLSVNPPTPGVWTRVAGDAVDIATLAAFATPGNRKRQNVKWALAAVAGVTLADVVTGIWLCEGREGPITRLSRRSLDRLEHRNEQRMRETQQRGGQFASQLAVEASR